MEGIISLQSLQKSFGAKQYFGRLAQLVQSTSFTPRGSGVRISHRPLKSFQ